MTMPTIHALVEQLSGGQITKRDFESVPPEHRTEILQLAWSISDTPVEQCPEGFLP